jgi:hypothetical protein
MRMKYLWIALNSTLVVVAFWDGHESLTPSRLLHKNPDSILCLIILLIMPVFALGTVEFSIRGWKVSRLARPHGTEFPSIGGVILSNWRNTCNASD